VREWHGVLFGGEAAKITPLPNETLNSVILCNIANGNKSLQKLVSAPSAHICKVLIGQCGARLGEDVEQQL